jgi:propionyl-CoA carboxylase alpha chain
MTQDRVRLSGWAVESRIYAEDPFRNFLPSVGRLSRYRPPREGRVGEVTVRNDSGVVEGSEISIFYDPMIAKLCTHAPTRTAAVDGMAEALDVFEIDGVRHNVPFLAALMAHPRWREGRLSTGFIAEEFPEGFKAPAPEGEIGRRMAAVAAAIDHLQNERKRRISGQMREHAFVRFDRERVVLLAGERHDVVIEDVDGGIAVAFADGTAWPVESHWRPGEPVWTGHVGGQLLAVQVRPLLNGLLLAHAGASAEARVYTRREADLAALMPEKAEADTGKQVLCPMPGLVKAIMVKAGQEVKAGEPLCIVEAMKMENVLRAERDATVQTVMAKEGDSLAVDAVILEFA